MAFTSREIADQLLASFKSGQSSDKPYQHWFLEDCLPADVMAAVQDLPFEAPDLGGVSGKREVHNATRKYFDNENQARHSVVSAISDAFQSDEIVAAVEETFGTDLTGAYLRIEFAQDTDGFWLEPHTDLGVKLFTCLLYVSDEPGHDVLGTDIYDAEKQHVGRSPFAPSAAMVFVPSDVTYHGFEPRPIPGIRKSLIINYVTDEWRAREQLAFPDQPIRH
jgi:hypothetical protein